MEENPINNALREHADNIETAFVKVRTNRQLAIVDIKNISKPDLLTKDRNEFNLLDWAILHHNFHNVEVLLKYIKPNMCMTNCFITLFSSDFARRPNKDNITNITRLLLDTKCSIYFPHDLCGKPQLNASFIREAKSLINFARALLKARRNMQIEIADLTDILMSDLLKTDSGGFNLLDWAIMFHHCSNIKILLNFIHPNNCRINCLMRLHSGIIQSPQYHGLEFSGKTLNLMVARGKPKLAGLNIGIYLYRENILEFEKVCALIIHHNSENNIKYEILEPMHSDDHKQYSSTLAWPTEAPENNKYVTIHNEEVKKFVISNCKFTQLNKKNITEIATLLILKGCEIPDILLTNPEKSKTTSSTLIFSSHQSACYKDVIKDAIEILGKDKGSIAAAENCANKASLLLNTQTDARIEIRRPNNGSRIFSLK